MYDLISAIILEFLPLEWSGKSLEQQVFNNSRVEPPTETFMNYSFVRFNVNSTQHFMCNNVLWVLVLLISSIITSKGNRNVNRLNKSKINLLHNTNPTFSL